MRLAYACGVIYARTHTHTHTRARSRARTHTHTHTRARARTHIYTQTYRLAGEEKKGLRLGADGTFDQV